MYSMGKCQLHVTKEERNITKGKDGKGVCGLTAPGQRCPTAGVEAGARM